MIFRARKFEFVFPRPALVMGIVNVTPDSFYDGGQTFSFDGAVSHGLKLVKQGADILDIGGESTRPGSTPVDEAEEMRRVIPVIKCLASQVQIPISVDTRKPGVAFSALQAGASIINDVGANRSNIDMWNVVAESLAGYVCMHMQGIPQSMQREPAYLNVVNEVADFFESRIQLMKGSGIKGDHVVLDPGIGFGKSIEHNLELLADLELLVRLQRPILLGVSRKSFIGKLLGTDLAERLPSSLACATLAVESGVQMIRAHDVAATVQAIRMTEGIVNRRKVGR